MKTTIIAVILLFSALKISAQVQVEIRAGAAVSSTSSLNMRIGPRAGVAVGYRFNRHIGIRSGLFYTMKGATKTNYIFEYDRNRALNLSYIDLPVEVSASFPLSAKSAIEVHGGPYISGLLKSSVPASCQFKVNKIDFGAGLGLDFIIGHFILSPEAQYGFTRIASDKSEHNITYAFSLGYRF